MFIKSNLLSFFSNDIYEVKKVLNSHLKSSNKSVESIMSGLPTDNGKLVRAIFVFIGGGYGNISRDRLVNIAAAIELLHLATLVHDDIIDDADLRRGKLAIHRSHGIKSAIFAGDYLFSESYTLFSKYTSPKSILNVSETIKAICGSEIEQFYSYYSLEVSVKDYLKRINGKCASLFRLSLSIGASEGDADPAIVKMLSKIGYYIGMTFQLIDDLLDVISSEDIIGKPSANDVRHGIYNLPIIYEVNYKNEDLINALNSCDIEDVIDILKHSEGMKKTLKLAKKYTERSLALISDLPNIPEKTFLKNIAETMLSRTF